MVTGKNCPEKNKLLKDNGRRHRMTDYYYECYEKMFDESIVNRWKTALES